ncbi:DUF1924 domain-containing protein [Undibacterium sp. FT137W]|uniref:DUF1924 domain-containing protein n=1 Tax=Undibacterium fentianense TaxID=2828728 RepID=A0A941E260_9BURK|nr:DUF1924 domain-containing protein [Undibacterium fentianense]MBR7800995.1 DUF1924 domain-containing protein [Undibacterium fentianense]
MGSIAISPTVSAETPLTILKQYEALSKQTASANRGQVLFTSNHGRDWSCSSCHGNPPTQTGKHASTGKNITPLAPSFNPERFTDTSKVEKWLRRNCNDVFGRECTNSEKADILSWLIKL